MGWVRGAGAIGVGLSVLAGVLWATGQLNLHVYQAKKIAAEIVATASDSRSRAEQLELGAHLSQECITCHRKGATGVGIPDITGRPAQKFVDILRAFKSGERSNPAMKSVARSLDDEQMAALAAYFATQ